MPFRERNRNGACDSGVEAVISVRCWCLFLKVDPEERGPLGHDRRNAYRKKTKNKANTPRGVLGSGRLRLQTWQSQLGEDRREAQHWLGHSEGCGRIEKCGRLAPIEGYRREDGLGRVEKE